MGVGYVYSYIIFVFVYIDYVCICMPTHKLDLSGFYTPLSQS